MGNCKSFFCQQDHGKKDAKIKALRKKAARAHAEGYAECREDAARLIETTVLLADDDDPTLDRGKYAAAIRALTPNKAGK